MSGLFFATPIGLTAIALLGAVAVMYLYRRRRQSLRVTGLFLWGRRRLEASAGRKRETLIRSRSFWLDMAAAVALILAAGGLSWRAEQTPLVIVLDDSFAMRSRDGYLIARAEAAALMDGAARRGGTVGVILAGVQPSVLRSMGPLGAGEAAGLLSRYEPASRRSDLGAAVALGRELNGDGNEFHIFTNRSDSGFIDGAVAGVMHCFAGAGDNVALTQVWRYAVPERPERENLAVVWRNYAKTETETNITVTTDDGAVLHRETRTLPPGGYGVAELEPRGAAERTWRVAVASSGEDVISADSEAVLPPQPVTAPAYAVRGLTPAAGRYVALALEAAGARPAVAPDLLVLGGDADGEAAMTVRVIAPDKPGMALPPYTLDYGSDLCGDIDLTGVAWAAATPDVVGNPEAVYIAAGTLPLLWRDGPERFFLNMAIEASPVVNEPAWPVLWNNFVNRCAERLPGLRKTVYRPGETLRCNVGRDGVRVAIRDDAGRIVRNGGRVPERFGVYGVFADTEKVGDVSVVPHYGEASDCRTLCRDAQTVRLGGRTESATRRVDLSAWCLAAALAALLANWILSGRSENEGNLS